MARLRATSQLAQGISHCAGEEMLRARLRTPAACRARPARPVAVATTRAVFDSMSPCTAGGSTAVPWHY